MIEQPRFSLLQKLGNGAYADVYQGVDAKFNGRKVAIKCYQSDASRNMGLCSLIIREISILKKVGYHPHIVQALDIVMASNGKIFLVMELMDTVTNFRALSHSSFNSLSSSFFICLYPSESL